MEEQDTADVTFGTKPKVLSEQRPSINTRSAAKPKKAASPKAVKSITKKSPRASGLMKKEASPASKAKAAAKAEAEAKAAAEAEITSPFNPDKAASKNPFSVLMELTEAEEAAESVAAQQKLAAKPKGLDFGAFFKPMAALGSQMLCGLSGAFAKRH